MIDTLHVNLWGVPGAKRAVASELHARLMRAAVTCELVLEYAKELGFSGELARVDADGDLVEVDQFIISAEQFRRENLLHGNVQVAITDAPVLAGVLYALEDDESDLLSLVRRRTSGWQNLDVLLVRDLGPQYGSRGRIRSREQALAMLPRIEQLLSIERPEHIRVSADQAAETIADEVLSRLRLGRHAYD